MPVKRFSALESNDDIPRLTGNLMCCKRFGQLLHRGSGIADLSDCVNGFVAGGLIPCFKNCHHFPIRNHLFVLVSLSRTGCIGAGLVFRKRRRPVPPLKLIVLLAAKADSGFMAASREITKTDAVIFVFALFNLLSAFLLFSLLQI